MPFAGPTVEKSDVSVIIPTHNRLALLKEAIASIRSQSAPPREIIVVDDGSDDGTQDWLSEHSDSQLKFLKTMRQGPAMARNLGVGRAISKWIAFLDSDDLWDAEKIAVQTNFMKKNPEYKVCQTEEIWIRQGIRVNSLKKHKKFSGHIFAACLKLCIISPSAVMMEREFFDRLGGFDPSFPVCEDYELWLRVSLESPVMTLPQALTIKRGGHEDQLSKKYWGMDRFRVRAMEKILKTSVLSSIQREALVLELNLKLSILANGYTKRNPETENPYLRKIQWLKENYSPERTGENPRK